MLPHMIEAGLASSDPAYSPGLWVGGWRTSSAMLSPKLWNEMVFPYLYEIVRAMHDAGRVSVLHLDHDWTRDLARFRELPAKACVLNPDGMTDVRKAKELLGDHMAIMGDVPAGLLVTGTPDTVRAVRARPGARRRPHRAAAVPRLRRTLEREAREHGGLRGRRPRVRARSLTSNGRDARLMESRAPV